MRSKVRTARHSRASPAASRGGLNSTENGTARLACSRRLCTTEGVAETIGGVEDGRPGVERPRTLSKVTGSV
ncbi:hypothetical protein FMUAM8_20090 [Nocardia cyriacigeorgica]|nr:hypothetical protein FMUAM8_20090 [Nocardia cyriacigeorgica]BDU05728.1 hypothetical protein FMUBM48_19910 [Nocardia cyriacigeorgica]